MSYELIVFPTPADAHCVLQTDPGLTIEGHPATHPSGRPGIGFTIPADHPNGNGAQITITAPEKVSLVQRGILFLAREGFAYPWTPGQTAAFAADDFHLMDGNSTLPRLVVSGNVFAQQVPDA